ncbi:family 43 glycosylhydrolase [Asticcacaulis biprosthecium]|nr:family 43 glycosylhydrolase [Asticcacaulis biprosthecium]
MMTKTTQLKLAVAALALLCGHANAQELKLNVSGTSKAWDNRVNPDYPIGIDEGSSPAVARGLSLRAGEKIHITATGGTQTFPNGTRIGPEGQQDYTADDYPGGSGRFFPSKYVDPSDFPAFLNQLIGVFVDTRGRIVGKPFPVGTDWKGLVPKGAVKLQFGINDDVLNDNSGEISVVIYPKANFPDSDLARLAPTPPPPPLILAPYPERLPAPIALRPAYNTLIADGSRYSADPAPLVANGKFYIISGRDEASIDAGGFVMYNYQIFETDDPATKNWKLYPDILRPEKVFAWAEEDGAWASQIVQGRDKRFYLYAPVREKNCKARNCMGIGVAVADAPLGPYQDIHPEGPILSQTTPVRNQIENIDPTVLIDDDGRVFIYWGTFGRLKGVELEKDMKTPKGNPIDVNTLTGFFEAPWIFKREGTYYMAYSANNAGPNSPCTEAVYHACQAYGTASSPLGPWTYHGVFLSPVTSATSHGGIVPFKDKWYLAYHNGDAKDGSHFRRSVAIDEVFWDDTVSPPAIKKVVQTRQPVDSTPTNNMAVSARITASNMPLPVQFRLRALNDEKTPPAPLPPDMWGNWTGRNDTPTGWIAYQWDKPVTVDATKIYFWGDQPTGAGTGVAIPKFWRIEYWDEAEWRSVTANGPYTTVSGDYSMVSFKPITTRCIRAVLDASTDAKSYAAFGVLEWQMLSPNEIVRPLSASPLNATSNCTQ